MGFCSNFPTNSAQDGRRDRKLLKTSAVLKVYKSMIGAKKQVTLSFEQGFPGVHSDRREASKAERSTTHSGPADTSTPAKRHSKLILKTKSWLAWLTWPHTGANVRQVLKYKACSLIFLLWISQCGGFLWIEWFALWKKYLDQFCILFKLSSVSLAESKDLQEVAEAH